MREGARISAADSRIVTEAPGTAGAEVDTGVLDLSNTQIAVTGARARGIASYASVAGSRSSITLSRGSRVDTQDGEALLAAGGDHVFTLDSSDITARAGGAVDGGLLLRSQSSGDAIDLRTPSGSATSPDIATGRIQLNAAASRLHGDVLIESGSADITLGRGSVLTGALIERRRPRQPSGAGCVQRLERARRFLAGGAGQRRHGRVRGAGRQGRLQDPDSQSVHRWRVTGAEYAAGR